MGFPCLNPPLYYCANEIEVVAHARAHGEVSATHYWLRQMEANMNLGEINVAEPIASGAKMLTLRVALQQRAAALGAFIPTLYPPGVNSPQTHVLYPFSGLDVLSAIHSFPSASSFVLLANLNHGHGLSCFADPYCVRMASRSTYKIVQNWARHHLAWLETRKMQQLFAFKGGCLPTLLFLLHIGGHEFESLHPLLDPPPPIGNASRPQSTSMSGAAAYAAAHHHSPLNGTVLRLLRASGCSAWSDSCYGNETDGTLVDGTLVKAGRIRCTFVSVYLKDDEHIHHLLHRQHILSGGIRSAPRYATILKAAPDEVTSLPWFQRWVLSKSSALLQDETGIPIPALLRAADHQEMRLSSAQGDGRGESAAAGGSSSVLHTRQQYVVHARAPGRANETDGLQGTGLEGSTWSLGAFGNFTRLTMARHFWNIVSAHPKCLERAQ